MLYRLSWKDEMILEGRAQGARETLLFLLEKRFGPVPDSMRNRIDSIRSLDRLNRLAYKAATARTLKSLRLGG